MQKINRRFIAICMTMILFVTACPLQKADVNAQTTYTFRSENQEVEISLREIKDNDYWYEYYLTVFNHSSQSVCDWSIELNVSDLSKFSKAFECSAKVDQSAGTLTVKGAGNNKVVAAGSSVSSDGSFKLGFSSAVSFTGGKITYSHGTQSSTGGVGYGNTYLDNYKCEYNLTGEAKTMAYGDTPVGKHGKLHVEGTRLTDEHGQSVILRGASTHGVHWGEWRPFVNKAAFRNLRDEWGVDMIRLVNYVTQGGYTQGAQGTLDTCIKNGVSYADELGMYAIIDWHVHAENPNDKKTEAIAFFDKYSKLYADHDNIIYEICNEPTGTPWAQIRPYAEDVVRTIRANDPDAIIVVGTNNWSQDVDEVATTGGGRINDANVMYTIHFYSGTHGQSLRNKVTTALDAGTPVFCTEFGICDASGNGGFNLEEADRWIDYFEEKGISYSCWSLCNKDESASMISPQCDKKSGWVNSDLGATGAWLINTYRSKRNDIPDATPNPSSNPTGSPTGNPSGGSVTNPTGTPTGNPSGGTGTNPTGAPTGNPSGGTGTNPTGSPTGNPSGGTVTNPTGDPSGNPSGGSVTNPTGDPSGTTSPGALNPGASGTPSATVTPAPGTSADSKTQTGSEADITGGTESDLVEKEDNTAIAANADLINTGVQSVWSGNKIITKWGGVKGAAGYEIYVTNCGSKMTKECLVGIAGANQKSFSTTKIKDKKLVPSAIYEVTVKAYRLEGGKKIYIAKSFVLHVAGNSHKKYTNAKKIKLSAKALTLKKGKSRVLKATVTRQDKKKKILSVKHAPSMRYITTNKKVAVVSGKGKVKAVGKGKCDIYFVAQNGVKAKVKVSVK